MEQCIALSRSISMNDSMNPHVRHFYKKLLSIARQLPPSAIPTEGVSNKIKIAFNKPVMTKGGLDAALAHGEGH